MITSIFVCGDIYNSTNNDGIICHKNMIDRIKTASYSICNFEAPIESIGKPYPKEGIHLCQNTNMINALKKQGFKLCLLANNHIMDYGNIGLKKTIEEINNKNLDYIGAGLNLKDAYKPLIKKINNIKVGLINACEAQYGVLDYYSKYNQSGYAWINHKIIDENIINLKNICDIIIVFSHAGLEKYNIPQIEWRYRYKHFCDLGADVVIGSHPHVPQGYEKYKESHIFYSLGNFFMDSPNYVNTEDKSFSLILNIKSKNNIDYEIIYHNKIKGKVSITDCSKENDINILNQKLNKNYIYELNKMNLDVYNKIIKDNLIFSLLPLPFYGSVKKTIYYTLINLLRRSKIKDKNSLLMHLLRNESYYYAINNALQYNYYKKNKGLI